MNKKKEWKQPKLEISYNNGITTGEIGFRVSNICEIPFSIEAINIQLFTCDFPNPLNSEGGTLIDKRIDLGNVSFDSKVLRQITNSDTIYTLKESSTAFFKIKYDRQEVESAKKSDCTVKQSRDILAEQNKPHKGDLMIFVNYINPQTGEKETLRKKVDK